MRRDLFAPNSRYFTTNTTVMKRADDTEVVYLLRRFCPPPEAFAVIAEHIRTADERLDHIAALHLGDPERFWLLCDANNVVDPAELTRTPGRLILITLPEGIPGGSPGM